MPNVTVNLSNLKKGTAVTVPGLGTFENGATTKIEKKVLDRFVASSPSASSIVKGDEVTITNDKKAKKPEKSAEEINKELNDSSGQNDDEEVIKEDEGD